MEEQTRTIRFTQNAKDERTGVQGYNGEEKTVLASLANRFVGGGVAVDVEPTALEDKSVEELKADAEALGIDLTGHKGSKDEIIKTIKKGA